MADGPITWTSDAETELKRIPFFFRKKARNATEDFARQRGQTTMTLELFREAMSTVAPGGPRGGSGAPEAS